MSHPPREGMSRRTPNVLTKLNNADNIERYLEEDGHRKWGVVIYRCTYDSDSDWQEFMKRLYQQAEKTLQFYNGLDLMESLDLLVFDDPSISNDASTAAIRDHFKEWATTALYQEQNTGPAQSQRYRYCIQVDDYALKSVISHDPEMPSGIVNLIWKDWVPTSDPREPMEEPIEGCTQVNVGWMIVSYESVIVSLYYHLRDWNAWYVEYRRPPEVADRWEQTTGIDTLLFSLTSMITPLIHM